jgi:anthranilate phosphoribosyltransferase
MQEAIARVMGGRSLSAREAESACGEIMRGQATPAQVAGLLVALRMKRETPDEVSGFARAMRGFGARLSSRRPVVVDTCGTGGDGKRTLNVSSGAALVAAGAGLAVAKHGNRAMSSQCGSADVFAELGVNVEAPPAVVEKCLNEAGIAFCFAQVFHPAMKHAAGPRRELGVRTIFNVLGPLTNPAGAQVQLIGVPGREVADLVALALARLGTGRSLVVTSRDGVDEVTTTAPVQAVEVAGHSVRRRFRLDGKDFGLRKARLSDLAGGSPSENARALIGMLRGEKGAFRDAVAFSAGVVCWLAGGARGIRQGIDQAFGAIDSGAALDRLERLKDLSRAAPAAAGTCGR